MTVTPTCRHCQSPLTLDFLDLGHAPPSNAYLTEEELSQPEIYYPLRLRACTRPLACMLGSLGDASPGGIP